jgi:hypothetical protein
MTKSKLAGLFAEFKKLSPSLAYEGTEREARLAWANEVLGRVVAPVGVYPDKGRDRQDGDQRSPLQNPLLQSWSELKVGEIRFLIKKAREQSGDGAAYRTTLLARIAADLWGAEWDAQLTARLVQRWRVARPDALTAAQAHAEIEELLSRLARRDAIDIEAARAKFRRGVAVAPVGVYPDKGRDRQDGGQRPPLQNEERARRSETAATKGGPQWQS